VDVSQRKTGGDWFEKDLKGRRRNRRRRNIGGVNPALRTDGLADLTLKFKTRDLVEAIGYCHLGDTVTLRLTGVVIGERLKPEDSEMSNIKCRMSNGEVRKVGSWKHGSTGSPSLTGEDRNSNRFPRPTARQRARRVNPPKSEASVFAALRRGELNIIEILY
jgi:hypothetical protein